MKRNQDYPNKVCLFQLFRQLAGEKKLYAKLEMCQMYIQTYGAIQIQKLGFFENRLVLPVILMIDSKELLCRTYASAIRIAGDLNC